jgi:hypothetical protein
MGSQCRPKNPGGSGFWVGGYMGQRRKWGSQFTSNRGTRWTDPVTKGGFQVSRRGSKGEQGEYVVYIACL